MALIFNNIFKVVGDRLLINTWAMLLRQFFMISTIFPVLTSMDESVLQAAGSFVLLGVHASLAHYVQTE